MLYSNVKKERINNLNEKYILKKIRPLKDFIDYSKNKLLFDEDQIYFNMSLISFDNKLHYAVRSGRKDIGKMYFHPEFTSTVYVGTIDKSLKDHREINVRFDDIKNGRLGLEDPRIFEWKKELYFSGDIPFNLIHKPQKNVFVNIKTGNHNVLLDPLNRRMSKNWMPYIENNELNFVTDIFPTRILNAATKNVTTYNDNSVVKLPVSCGPRVIEIDGYKTTIVHGRANNAYWHSIAQWDDDWKIRISDPFYFVKPGIEFSTGYEVHKDSLYFTYSEYDDGVVLCKLDLKSFLNSEIWRMNV
jgi:hypothetical protein